MNRKDFQKLTDIRLKDAEALLKSKRYAAAYYICGYIIECALKTCIAKQTKKFDFPPKGAQNFYKHKSKELIGPAGLELLLDKDAKNNPELKSFWNTVKDWSEESRYETKMGERKARDLFNAISDDKNGILTWIKKHW